MNLSVLKNINAKGVTTLAAKTSHLAKRFAPEILTGVGVTGVVISGVLASKATLRLEPIVDQAKTSIDITRAKRANTDYTEREYVKDLTNIYTHRSIQVVKLYGPSISLGVVSIACIVGAHGIMRKRNVALVAAYKGLEETFSQYRKRVVDVIGEDKEREIRFGYKEEEIVGEDGKTKTVTSVNPGEVSPYTRIFDENCQDWDKTPEYNMMFLTAEQNYANDMLNARGHVFLNDVYDRLDFPRTEAGAVVGWLRSDHPEAKDGKVDFGIFRLDSERHREFVNGHEASVILDFNVDGVIFNKI